MYMHPSHLYDLFDYPSEESANQQEFFLTLAQSCKQALDVGAGSGTIAMHLAENGISVTCLEPSPSMFSLLIARLAYRPDLWEFITPLPHNAIDFKLASRFPIVYASNVLHLVPGENSRIRLITNLVNHLEAEGFVIIDFRIGSLRPQERECSGDVRLGNIEYKRYTTIKRQDKNLWSYTWLFELQEGNGCLERHEEHFLVRTDSPEGCRSLLQECGLAIDVEYSDYSFSEFVPGENGNRHIIVARPNG